MKLNIYVFCFMMPYVWFVDHVQGETYSFQKVSGTDVRNRCLLANQSTICDPVPMFCDVKDTISDISLIDGENSTWIDGFYYKSMWIANTGCITLTDSELDILAVKHVLGDSNNIENCVVSCGSTTPTLGLVNETCYCINTTSASLRFIPNQMCSLPCPGNPSETCGASQTSPTIPKFMTVYQRAKEQKIESEELEAKGNCRAINYTSTSVYRIVSRNCSEQLSFSCNSLYISPVFYNFGNYTWDEARVFCQQLNYILTETFDFFAQPETLEFNTLYWIGHFRVENYYWGYDLPMTSNDDDPVPQCLSINGSNGSYSVVRNECNSSMSAFCLPQMIEVSTMSEQSSTETDTTEISRNNTVYTTDSSIESSTEIVTDSSSDTSTEIVTDSSSDTSTETVTDSSSDTITETVTDSSSDTSTETVTDSSSDTSTEIVTDSSSDTSTEIVTDSSSDTSTEIVTDSFNDTSTEIVTDSSSDTITEIVTDSSSDTSTEIVPDSSTDNAWSSDTTDSTNAISTEVSSNYTPDSTSYWSSETTTEMASVNTMSSYPMTDITTASSTKTSTKLSSTNTMSPGMVTDNLSTPAGQAELLTSSAAMYIGVSVGALVLLAGIPIITIIVLRRKQKIRQSVNRLEASVYDVTRRRSKRDRESIVNKLQDDEF